MGNYLYVSLCVGEEGGDELRYPLGLGLQQGFNTPRRKIFLPCLILRNIFSLYI